MRVSNALFACAAFAMFTPFLVFAEESNIVVQRADHVEKKIEKCPSGVEKLPPPTWTFNDKRGNKIEYEDLSARTKKRIDEYRCPELKGRRNRR